MNRNLIYDLGFHVGQDTEFYLKKGFRVIAVEANPMLVREGEARFSEEIKSGQLTLLNVGIGDKTGTFPFYVNKELSHWSSFDFKIGTQRGEYDVIEVEMTPLVELFMRYGIPYYLKIDIEGMDFIALQSLHYIADRPQYVSIENGPPFMLRELVNLGYTQFKFINQKSVPEMQLQQPAREGFDIFWKFPFGASGPFGEDTPGKWLAESEVLEEINAYWDNPKRDANIHGWFDLHGKRD